MGAGYLCLMKRSTTPALLLYAIALGVSSCSVIAPWAVPQDLTGTWTAAPAAITVRTEEHWMHFTFTSDTIPATITIHPDKTVTGVIGNSRFSGGELERNNGNPEKTGVAYIVECRHVAHLFPNDPLEAKEVELWLGIAGDTMQAELRQTEGGAMFPMGDFRFVKTAE